MAWITLTPDDLADVMSVPEINALKAYFTATDTPDPLPDILASVSTEVRGYCSAGGIPLGDDGMIPGELKRTALIMARTAAANRFPAKIFSSLERSEEQREAVKRLQDVAQKRFFVNAATTFTAETSTGPVPSIMPKCRQFTRWEQDGA